MASVEKSRGSDDGKEKLFESKGQRQLMMVLRQDSHDIWNCTKLHCTVCPHNIGEGDM